MQPNSDKWTLIRDLGILQVKLVVDGLRDLILVPASLIAGLISLASSRDGIPGLQFYRLLAWGKDSELWINLFGALNNVPVKIHPSQAFGDQDIDVMIGRLEAFVLDEVKRGGVSAQAKDRLEKLLSALRRRKPDAE